MEGVVLVVMLIAAAVWWRWTITIRPSEYMSEAWRRDQVYRAGATRGIGD